MINDFQERADYLAAQLHRTFQEAALESRGQGAEADPGRIIFLIGLALLLRKVDSDSPANNHASPTLVSLQEHGRTAIIEAALTALPETQPGTFDFSKEFRPILESESHDFGDVRIRSLCKKVEQIDVPQGTDFGDYLLGRAFHGLIDLSGIDPGAGASLSRLVATLAAHGSDQGLVSDPFCGCGFLAFETAFQMAVGGKPKPAVEGKEVNKARWLLANLLGAVYGFACRIEFGDALRHPPIDNTGGLRKYDLIVCEPPFGGRVSPAETFDPFNRFPETTSASEWLALQHIVASLGDLGKAVVLVPPAVLFSKGAGARVRGKWINSAVLRSVISLPRGVWQPVSSHQPVILVFDKTPQQKHWFDTSYFQIRSEGFVTTAPKMRGRKIIPEENIISLVKEVNREMEDNSDSPDWSKSTRSGGLIDEGEVNPEMIADGYDLSPARQVAKHESAYLNFVMHMSKKQIFEAVEGQRKAEKQLDELVQKYFPPLPRAAAEEDEMWDMDDNFPHPPMANK